jgi:hypothetical protein
VKTTQGMTAKEYYAYRLAESQAAIMGLLAKVENPYGDKLSEILLSALHEIEALQDKDEA